MKHQSKRKSGKSEKLNLIIDSRENKNVSHEMIRLDSSNQLEYLSNFLMNYLDNKNKVKDLISLSNIDFCEFANGGILFIFMAILHKKKSHNWKPEDYFIL